MEDRVDDRNPAERISRSAEVGLHIYVVTDVVNDRVIDDLHSVDRVRDTSFAPSDDGNATVERATGHDVAGDAGMSDRVAGRVSHAPQNGDIRTAVVRGQIAGHKCRFDDVFGGCYDMCTVLRIG